MSTPRGSTAGGRSYAALAGPLPRIETRYGVPGQILLAIWGHETNYGSYTGDFDLARSLATLAWEGRRRELFAGEFIALLKMADQGVPREPLVRQLGRAPSAIRSSCRASTCASPSTATATATRDIWTSQADTLASIANYFRDAGWRRGQPWGVRASSARRASTARRIATRLVRAGLPAGPCPPLRWKTVAEWRALGVTPQGYDRRRRDGLAVRARRSGHAGLPLNREL